MAKPPFFLYLTTKYSVSQQGMSIYTEKTSFGGAAGNEKVRRRAADSRPYCVQWNDTGQCRMSNELV